MFGVLIFALNESKFVGYALRSYLDSSLVECIIVVEGCVELNAHAANDYGLSRDDTADVIEAIIDGDESERIIYERYGWAANKAELRNRCVELCGEWHPDVGYYLQTDADEIIPPDDLAIVAAELKRHKPDVTLFKYWHFWKQPDLVATGSLWNAYIHRCYKNYGLGMRFPDHAGAPCKPDGKKLKSNFHSSVKVYHYGPMKERQEVWDKLTFYQNRDGLGVDTWTNWQRGDPTHWTHGGGAAVPFAGEHPPAIAGDVWDLVPRG